MAKKPTFTMEFDTKFRDFKFSNESFFKGANEPTSSGWKKLSFKHTIDKKGHTLVNPNERKIAFHFTLEMHPDLGEINFDGECILESPEQQKISFTIQNMPQFSIAFIDPVILKNSYYNAEKIWKKHGLKLPSVDQILKIPLKK